MDFNYLNHPYSSQRVTNFAKNGMVATSQPLAAQAGLEILKKGGNAVDAAIATAACLTVVEPTSNGIGSDAFAQIWFKNKLYAINGSGPAPGNISIEKVKKRGYQEMPEYGLIPVTIPGAPATWARLSKKFGNLSLTEILKPAISYAQTGYPISPVLGSAWQKSFQNYKKLLQGDQFKYWFKTFAPAGKAPVIGEIWRSPGHASTLRQIAQTEAESFYKGALAKKIVAFSKKYNGFISEEDLASYSPEWVEPVKINYRGYDVWEIPPNGQGLVALIALNILKGFNFTDKEKIDTYHKQIEALKLAFADGKNYITDQNDMTVQIEDLLSDTYAAERRQLIKNKAILPDPGSPAPGGTVYLATADKEGNMVSFIQSNYLGFGSGLVVPETGIALQNRGSSFSLDPEHDNCLKPGKRPYHTIIPGFLTKGGQAVGPFGVMGGFMQPQGHLQVLMNTIDFKLNPQAALDAPRWQWVEGKKIKLEHSFPHHLAKLLAEKGHSVEVALSSTTFGRGQIIWKDEKNQVLIGGTESRADSAIASW